MAKIIITIDVAIENGAPVATATFDLDMQGATEGTPTTAVLFGTTIQRLWKSRALGPLVPLVSDMIRLQRRHLANGEGSGQPFRGRGRQQQMSGCRIATLSGRLFHAWQ